MEVIDWVFFFVEILIVMLVLYVATRVVCKEDIVTASYALRLFVTAFLAVVVVPLFIGILQGALGLGILGVAIAIIIAFLLLVVIIRYIIVSEASLGDELVESILIALITIIVIYIINVIVQSLFGLRLLGGII